MANQYFFRIKEKFFKYFFLFQDRLSVFLFWLAKSCDFVLFLSGLTFAAILIARLGFSSEDFFSLYQYSVLRSVFLITYVAKYIQEVIRFRNKRRWAQWIEGLFFLVSSIVLYANWPFGATKLTGSFLSGQLVILMTLVILFLSEGYKLVRIINSVKLPPSLLFSMSFLFLIFIGSGLLMLPDVQQKPVSYLDALFTSASAVCVTGLVVVDTATAFTFKGHVILLILIQLGGLGIMAFTGFFAYAFTGTVSFKDRILLKDVFSAETLGGIFKILLKIILFTFIIEGLGAILIYAKVGHLVEDPVFFSVFHAISAFCNAGFSILPDGLADQALVGQNSFFLSIAGLIILGGIGFPVLLSLYDRLRYSVFKNLRFSTSGMKPKYSAHNKVAQQIAIATTLFLLVIGTCAYYFFEHNASNGMDSEASRWMMAFFGSTTSRTAGFNMVDMSTWSYPTIVMMIGLMWIGASPGSTGGGIKTTTFSIAVRAAWNFIRGRHRIEIGFRQIGFETVSRVLVVIILSFLFIFSAFLMVLIAEPEHNPIHLLFETVSAYSTVGLSLAGTSSFGPMAKGVIIVLMFIGRVGPLTLLSGIFVSQHKKYYKYPECDLTIN